VVIEYTAFACGTGIKLLSGIYVHQKMHRNNPEKFWDTAFLSAFVLQT
jgi:hypothetical protein